MAACVVAINGVLNLTADPATACPGFVVVDSAEYALNSTLAGLVAVPGASDFAAVWAIGFMLPLTFALVGWACGAVLSPLKR